MMKLVIIVVLLVISYP
ncbi:TPA: type I toxin-antitoxin system Ibs family toxin, partial [Escherichia coli]